MRFDSKYKEFKIFFICIFFHSSFYFPTKTGKAIKSKARWGWKVSLHQNDTFIFPNLPADALEGGYQIII